MKKLTNAQKILKALKSGPKTQADLVRETKVKNVYQIISDLKKKNLVFMDTGKYVHLHTPKETESLNTKPRSSIRLIPEKEKAEVKRILKAHEEAKKEALSKVYKFEEEKESEIITILRNEAKNIQDGIRSLMMAQSYLLRRIEEEKRDA